MTTPTMHCVPAGRCHRCGDVQDMTVGGGRDPRPGDVAVCLRCAAINVLDHAGRLARPEADVMAQLAANEVIQEIRSTIVAGILAAVAEQLLDEHS